MPTLVRKVLNLPDKQDEHSEPPVTPSCQNGEDVQAAERRELLERTWLAKDADDDAETKDTAATAKVARPSNQSSSMFSEIDESGWSTWGRRAGRALVFGCIGLMALLGVRDVFVGRPGASTTATKTTTHAGLPTAQAQAVATRWATTYLTWDSSASNDDAQRQTELARDTAPGVDLTDSWNGSGAQHVVSVLPGQVSVTGTVGRAVIYAQVAAGAAPSTAPSSSPSPSSTKTSPAKPSKKPTPKTDKKKPSKTSKAAAPTGALNVEPAALAADSSSPSTAASDKTSWVSLSVPVAWDGHRVVVAGLPAFVGTAAPQAAPGVKEVPSQDDNLTETTQDAATAFFSAYAGNDAAAIQAATAPGAQITPLGGSVKFISLQKWSVFQTPQQRDESDPSKTAGAKPIPDKQRDAQAVVTWQVGAAQITQVYDVRLAPLSGGGSSTWRVASVTASTYPVSN